MVTVRAIVRVIHLISSGEINGPYYFSSYGGSVRMFYAANFNWLRTVRMAYHNLMSWLSSPGIILDNYLLVSGRLSAIVVVSPVCRV
jgi:hypothetical protein